jgi:hypothetical protein
MTYSQQRENIKVCPECGTNLINTARHCAVCNHQFIEADLSPAKGTSAKPKYPQMIISINLPVLFGLILLLVTIPAMIFFGLQKREKNNDLDAAARATGTYIATTYLSPTPSPTLTFTPGPPTPTNEVYTEYQVAPGDSCLSIAKRFNLYLDSLLSKNTDVDCSLLSVGTVLRIPKPTPTPEPTGTEETTPAP